MLDRCQVCKCNEAGSVKRYVPGLQFEWRFNGPLAIVASRAALLVPVGLTLTTKFLGRRMMNSFINSQISRDVDMDSRSGCWREIIWNKDVGKADDVLQYKHSLSTTSGLEASFITDDSYPHARRVLTTPTKLYKEHGGSYGWSDLGPLQPRLLLPVGLWRE